jgi:hypothetical protein
VNAPSRARAFQAAAGPVAKDTRVRYTRKPRVDAELVTCQVCGAEVYTVAHQNQTLAKKGETQLQRHRHGGGHVSFRRNDAPCNGGRY